MDSRLRGNDTVSQISNKQGAKHTASQTNVHRTLFAAPKSNKVLVYFVSEDQITNFRKIFVR